MASELLQQAIALARTGNKGKARRLLENLIHQEPNNEAAWIWMTDTVESDYERRVCLQKVLSINPSNLIAKEGLRRLCDTGATLVAPGPIPAQRGISQLNLPVVPDTSKQSQFRRPSAITDHPRNSPLSGRNYLIVIIMAILLSCTLCGWAGLLTIISPTSTRTPNPTNTTMPKVGENVEVDNMRWKVVQSFSRGSVLRSSESRYGSLFASKDRQTPGYFLQVEVEVENVGKTQKSVYAPTLFDSQNRSYEHAAHISDWVPSDEVNLTYSEDINPNLKRSFVLIYELANDAKGLKLEVPHSVFSPQVFIDLGK